MSKLPIFWTFFLVWGISSQNSSDFSCQNSSQNVFYWIWPQGPPERRSAGLDEGGAHSGPQHTSGHLLLSGASGNQIIIYISNIKLTTSVLYMNMILYELSSFKMTPNETITKHEIVMLSRAVAWPWSSTFVRQPRTAPQSSSSCPAIPPLTK